MKKLVYLAAMALLGLGLTMAQSSTPASDPSNSSKPTQTPSGTASSSGTPDSSQTTGKAGTTHKHHATPHEEKIPDPSVQDQQSSTNSTTGASGQTNSTPPSSSRGTTGANAEPENTPPAKRNGEQPGGEPTDQQPNSSSPPSPHHLAMATTPAARAVATHSPDPGTCMNPAAMDSNGNAASVPSRNPNCD